jgi:class 3 adenylate cyclase
MACAASIDSEVAFVAAGCGAEIDPWPAGDALLSFRHPADALAAAIELSQLMGRTTLQIGLSTGQCRIASIADGDSQIQVAVGPAVDAASDACQMAPAGTVRMTAAAYAELQNSVANLRNCLVAAEYDHDGMEAVSLTFAPSASDALSTFAGLGLT